MAVPKWIMAKKNTRSMMAIVIGLDLLGTILFLILGRKFSLDARGGFLGTHAPLYSDINLVVEILIIIGLIIGYLLIRHKDWSGHQYMQTAMVLLNLVMTILFMGIIFVQIFTPGTTISLPIFALIAHGTVGVIALLTGLFLLLQMNNFIPKNWKVKKYKNLMRFAFCAYCAVAVGGLAIYCLFYVGF
jgi:uncharacterized membrane protein YozB (DUF420 family)